MILYVNGDSHSCGVDLVNTEFSWPSQLQKKLKCTLINHARIGNSNPGILRTTLNFLDQIIDKKMFVVIGWTGWEREEWEYQGSHYNVNASGLDSVPNELSERYKNWVIEQNDNTRFIKSKKLHQEIFELHQTFNNEKIPHLFFNALMPFQHETLTDNSSRFAWGVNYLEPYNNGYAYYWFLNQHGYRSNPLYHHGELAQQYWAEFLYSYIQQHQII